MKTHGESETRLHNVWMGVLSRCYCATNTAYRYYGGRGIRVCDEWRASYLFFRDWAMANGYAEGLHLDRICNDGNYEPSNCRWVTRFANCRNRSNNVMVAAFGETKTLIEWTEDPRCVVGYINLRQRIRNYGWDAEAAITTPTMDYGQAARMCRVAHPFYKRVA